MPEFNRGDSRFYLYKEEFEKGKREIANYNIHQVITAIRASEEGKKLEALYGTPNYFLMVMYDSRGHDERLENFSINSFVTTVRVKQVQYTVDVDSSGDVVGTGNYSGTIKSNGDISISEDTMELGGSTTYSIDIKSNNLENVKVRAYHFASENSSFNRIFNSVINSEKLDEYKNMKAESSKKDGKGIKYHKRGALMCLIQVLSILGIIFIPILSYFFKTDIFSFAALGSAAIFLAVQIIVLVFSKRMSKRRRIDTGGEKDMDKDLGLTCWWAMIHVIFIVISAIIQLAEHMESNIFLGILRIAGIILPLALLVTVVRAYRLLLPDLRDSDDKAELYLASSKLSEFEANVEFVRQNIICKKL